jgi:hypothetical protein
MKYKSQKVIVINSEDCNGNYPAMEYFIIKKEFGLNNIHWQLVTQTYQIKDGKKFDILKIRILKDKNTKEVLNPSLEKEIYFELR